MDRETHSDNSYDIDKLKMGRFIRQKRKELGLTQKQLAQKLFVSDKAVSKWETGNALPDTGLLMPLADCLGVGVADLLTGAEQAESSDKDAEVLLRKVAYYSENLSDTKNKKTRFKITAALAMFIMAQLILAFYLTPDKNIVRIHGIAVSAIFARFVYFMLFALEKLPAYYDENRIGYYAHAGVRIHFPGVAFNNSNWPHVLKAIRCSLAVLTSGYIPFILVLNIFIRSPLFAENPGAMSVIANALGLPVLFLILFLPMYIAAKKYE